MTKDEVEEELNGLWDAIIRLNAEVKFLKERLISDGK